MRTQKPVAWNDDLIDEMIAGCRRLRAQRAACLGDQAEDDVVTDPILRAEEPGPGPKPPFPSNTPT
ncbi:MAG: hypothetical protein H6970_02595 [Gammaproteobacteria bacterium]|nr:hypothetical protein [Gammaproteobacteria bacterium]MCP5459426.1 hypothetical protein [Gammaproteobacteria bacterium]